MGTNRGIWAVQAGEKPQLEVSVGNSIRTVHRADGTVETAIDFSQFAADGITNLVQVTGTNLVIKGTVLRKESKPEPGS